MENQFRQEFARFLSHRNRLKERLAETGAELDDWLEANGGEPPQLSAIAGFVGMLATRRELLQELAALDDAFIDRLLTLQGNVKGAGL